MDKLIEALQIFLKYKNEEYPTNCGHDALYIMGVHRDMVSRKNYNRGYNLYIIHFILALRNAWRFMNHVPSVVTRKIYSGTGFERQKDGTLKLLDAKEIKQ